MPLDARPGRRVGRGRVRPAAPLEQTRHYVEATSRHAARLARMCRQPRARTAAQTPLFTRIDGLRRDAVASVVGLTSERAAVSAPRPEATALHLDEGERRAALRNEIDLDPFDTDVARDDAIPSALEMARRTRLTLSSEPSALVRRASSLGPA